MAIGLVLGGGAPNLPLMTGALLALDEAGVDFKVITTTGAGMVAGLLYAAPRKKKVSDGWVDTRRAALRATRDWGIDDLIYDMFPMNYKIFQKPGKLAQAYSHATNPFLWSIPRKSRRQRLLGDSLAFWAAAMSPSDMRPSSTGLCQPPPWIEMLVDFGDLEENLAEGDKKFRLSAFCIEDESEKTFEKHEITADHFKAALAMPFIYSPYKLRGEDGTWKTYLEGSAFRTLQLNPDHVMCDNDIDTIIYFDLMGNRHLIGEPKGLIDAWGKSIVAPLTRLAELEPEMLGLRRDLHQANDEISRLKAELAGLKGEAPPDALGQGHDHTDTSAHGADADSHSHAFFDETKILRMPFRDHIPEEHWKDVLDWSYSNMSTLFDIGVKTGEVFAEEHRERLDDSMRSNAGQAREEAHSHA